jgi:YidC/Oxa1 family membrane protein insertase
VDQRAFTRFILVAGVAFLAMSLLQQWVLPPPVKPKPPVAAQQSAGGEAAAKPLLLAEDSQVTGNKAAESAADKSPRYEDAEPHRLISLGSFGADRPDKLLVTLDSRGGTVRRIELNARFPNGKLKYYDQEVRGGYIGNLELVENPRGCEVRVVGAGTPADRAGLRPGDVITSIGGEPIVSALDFAAKLENSRVGDWMTVAFERGTEAERGEQTCSIELVQRPVQVFGPETGPEYPPPATPPASFMATLRKPEGPVWPELDEQLTQVNWKMAERDVGGVPVVEFSHEIPATSLARSGIAGPLRVIKRYWLPPSSKLDDFDKNFHLHMQLEVENLSDQPMAASWDIAGPAGMNIEGWWYQVKIHGRSSAIGYSAGARDIVAGSEKDFFQFKGNAEILKNYLRPQPELQAVVKHRDDGNALHFVGVDTLYFLGALIPAGGDANPVDESLPPQPFDAHSAFVYVFKMPPALRDDRSLHRTADFTFRLFSNPFSLEGAGGKNSLRQSFVIFAGPKEPRLLEKYAVARGSNVDDVVTFGWFAAFSKPLVWLLRFFYSLVGNYGIAIVMLTVIVRLLLMPISRKIAMNAQVSSKIMQAMSPEMKRLAEKYKNDMEGGMRAQQELFQRHGFNPIKQQFGGCLLVFLQSPIFIGLYRGLSVDVALRGQPLIPGWSWCSDLAAPDQLLYWKNWMPGFLGAETGWFGPYLNLLPLVTIALFLLQTKLFMPPPTDEQQKMAQRMMTFMMIIMSVMFFKVPSGLCLYFITSSIWGMVERWMLPKPKLPAGVEGQAESGAGSARPVKQLARR